MNQLTADMMTDTFDFQEALSYIKAGMAVSLTILDIKRVYNLDHNGEIICTPNGKNRLTYRVNTFHIDAVMSDNWKLEE